jgi:hypothetical protein
MVPLIRDEALEGRSPDYVQGYYAAWTDYPKATYGESDVERVARILATREAGGDFYAAQRLYAQDESRFIFTAQEILATFQQPV